MHMANIKRVLLSGLMALGIAATVGGGSALTARPAEAHSGCETFWDYSGYMRRWCFTGHVWTRLFSRLYIGTERNARTIWRGDCDERKAYYGISHNYTVTRMFPVFPWWIWKVTCDIEYHA
jgi:hypothetical protein